MDTINRKGYIYGRFHDAYDTYDAYKLGKATNIPERDGTYSTGEIKRGHFGFVYEVPIEKINIAEKLLQIRFYEYNVYIDGGREFYKKSTINDIASCFNKHRIPYRLMAKDEVNLLVRKDRIRQKLQKLKGQIIKSIRIIGEKTLQQDKSQSIRIYTPRQDQEEIIETTLNYLRKNMKGMLILMCGVGKTLISLWSAQRMSLNKILIGVPNILLLKQWVDVVKDLYQNIPYHIVSGNVGIDDITLFLEKNREKHIIITTYSSSYKVYQATQKIGHDFEIKILDEVHHLTSSNYIENDERKTFIKIMDVPSLNQLGLTATLKTLENRANDRDENIIISNDNKEYFGDIIERKCLLWAINKNIICDYLIQTIITNEEQLEDHLITFGIEDDNDKRLFLSAFVSLKSITEGHSHHLLVYCNNIENSQKIIQYIEKLIEYKYFQISDIYYSKYDSEMGVKEQASIIKSFKLHSYGIITCVYCLGEGWDFPLLDGVVFSENMSSNIRILQSALRACRRNPQIPAKKSKIILPILDLEDSSDLKKVKEVIYQMGLEDETISQKIKVFHVDIKKHDAKTNRSECIVNEFGEYNADLTQNLRLKTVNRAAMSITYERAKRIIAEKAISNRQDYYNLCDVDNRLSKEPDIIFKGQFTNWIDYLSIERIYYDLEICKNKVYEYLEKYPQIKSNYLELSKACEALCRLDDKFPPNGLWVEYYGVDLGVIFANNLKIKKKTRGVVL
jgi:superfamily II DNA or RNA helicase